MKRGIFIFLTICLIALGLYVPSHAILIDNSDTIIEQDRNIMWIKDANLAAANQFGVSGIVTSGVNAGTMSWTTANEWISAIRKE